MTFRRQTTGRPSFRPKMNNGRYQKKRNPKQEMYGENWEELSAYVRKRDDYTCKVRKLGVNWRCNVQLKPPFHWLLHVHHIIPLPKGPNHPKNLITLCRECHGRIHGKYLGSISEKQKRAGRNMR